jgi:cytochrome c biogenesis protein CcmG/thiol:disulfide interchange protein DsbE
MIAPSRDRLRLIRYPAITLVTAAVVFFGGRGVLSAAPASTVAPGFSLASLKGDRDIDLSTYAGKTVVLNFWASWCGPCAQEADTLERASKRWSAEDIAFIGVDVHDSVADGQAFVEHHGITYPVAVDPEGGTASTYGLPGLPQTVIVSGDGRIVNRMIGPVARARLDHVLGGLTS